MEGTIHSCGKGKRPLGKVKKSGQFVCAAAAWVCDLEQTQETVQVKKDKEILLLNQLFKNVIEAEFTHHKVYYSMISHNSTKLYSSHHNLVLEDLFPSPQQDS